MEISTTSLENQLATSANANSCLLHECTILILVISTNKRMSTEGEGGMIWENGIEICIISYVKRVASPGSMHDSGCLGLVHWDDPEG